MIDEDTTPTIFSGVLINSRSSGEVESSSSSISMLEKMKIRLPILALITILLLTQPALAWNDFGHETVAWVCYEQLTPQVKQRCNALLKLNPLYSSATNIAQEAGGAADPARRAGLQYFSCTRYRDVPGSL